MTTIEVLVSDAADDQVSRMCHEYWETMADGEYTYTVAALAKRHGLRSSDISKIVKGYSEALVPGSTCSGCAGTFVVTTRTDMANFVRLPHRSCRDCIAAAAERKRLESEAIEATRRATVQERYAVDDDHEVKVEPSDLRLRDAFLIAALLDAGEEELTGLVVPLGERAIDLAPTESFGQELVGDLEKVGLLLIHPNTPVNAFEWDGEQLLRPLDPAATIYYIAGNGSLYNRAVRYQESFKTVIRREDWPSHWLEEFPRLWLDLCISECESYLVRQLAKRNLAFSPGSKTRETLTRGLQRYTLGQMYYFIYFAAAGAADYYAKGLAGKQQAANSAVTRLSANIDRYYAEGRAPKEYSQSHNSTLWHLLMVRAMKLPSPESFSPISQSRTVLGLNWKQLDPTAFERLVFQLAEEAPEYEEVRWLMRTNAPDHGRDVSAVRITSDSLSGQRVFRVVIQCKHWLSRSISGEDIGKETIAVEHWEHPPFDVMIMATSGRFTADAVTWTERHNAKGIRPHVELWNDAHLETLLADRPHLVLMYELR